MNLKPTLETLIDMFLSQDKPVLIVDSHYEQGQFKAAGLESLCVSEWGRKCALEIQRVGRGHGQNDDEKAQKEMKNLYLLTKTTNSLLDIAQKIQEQDEPLPLLESSTDRPRRISKVDKLLQLIHHKRILLAGVTTQHCIKTCAAVLSPRCQKVFVAKDAVAGRGGNVAAFSAQTAFDEMAVKCGITVLERWTDLLCLPRGRGVEATDAEAITAGQRGPLLSTPLKANIIFRTQNGNENVDRGGCSTSDSSRRTCASLTKLVHLHYVNGSIPSYRVQILLNYLDIAHTTNRLCVMSHPRPTKTKEFLENVNARGEGPVLEVQTTSTTKKYQVRESLALLEFITDLLFVDHDVEQPSPVVDVLGETAFDKAYIRQMMQESERLRFLIKPLSQLYKPEFRKKICNLNREPEEVRSAASMELIGAMDKILEELKFWEDNHLVGATSTSGCGDRDEDDHAETTEAPLRFLGGFSNLTLADCAFFPILAFLVQRGFPLVQRFGTTSTKEETETQIVEMKKEKGNISDSAADQDLLDAHHVNFPKLRAYFQHMSRYNAVRRATPFNWRIWDFEYVQPGANLWQQAKEIRQRLVLAEVAGGVEDEAFLKNSEKQNEEQKKRQDEIAKKFDDVLAPEQVSSCSQSTKISSSSSTLSSAKNGRIQDSTAAKMLQPVHPEGRDHDREGTHDSCDDYRGTSLCCEDLLFQSASSSLSDGTGLYVNVVSPREGLQTEEQELYPEDLFGALKSEIEWSTMLHKGGLVPRLVANQGILYS
ncbi:unnamed protein product [Amoebophrya sp. A25]|nr:unnamed protein product [Amoebophrya sp. A25]|eukprot:GSA25T00001323001.1